MRNVSEFQLWKISFELPSFFKPEDSLVSLQTLKDFDTIWDRQFGRSGENNFNSAKSDFAAKKYVILRFEMRYHQETTF